MMFKNLNFSNPQIGAREGIILALSVVLYLYMGSVVVPDLYELSTGIGFAQLIYSVLFGAGALLCWQASLYIFIYVALSFWKVRHTDWIDQTAIRATVFITAIAWILYESYAGIGLFAAEAIIRNSAFVLINIFFAGSVALSKIEGVGDH